MIQLQNFKRHQASGHPVYFLKEISLKNEEGDFISIMEPSSSGESILLNISGVLNQPSEGSYHRMSQPVFY